MQLKVMIVLVMIIMMVGKKVIIVMIMLVMMIILIIIMIGILINIKNTSKGWVMLRMTIDYPAEVK